MLTSVSMRAAVMVVLMMSMFGQDQTSSLTGKVRDITGATLPGTVIELRSEKAPGAEFRSAANGEGVYNFYGLPAGSYTMRLACPGFHTLTIKSIEIAPAESKELPVAQLEIGSMADCGGHGVLDYRRFLSAPAGTGDLVGSVRAEGGKNPPIAGAEVMLICAGFKVCGTTRSDAKGAFGFKAVRAGYASVRVRKPGFYGLDQPEFTVQEGAESTYRPVYLERCATANCDPRKRPANLPFRVSSLSAA